MTKNGPKYPRHGSFWAKKPEIFQPSGKNQKMGRHVINNLSRVVKLSKKESGPHTISYLRVTNNNHVVAIQLSPK